MMQQQLVLPIDHAAYDVVCIECKDTRPRQQRKRCSACQLRIDRLGDARLLNLDVTGGILCLCGCGKPAEKNYLTERCYHREHQRKMAGRRPSLLLACPVRYVAAKEDKPFIKPTPYTGDDLQYLPRDMQGRITPDRLFSADAVANMLALKKW